MALCDLKRPQKDGQFFNFSPRDNARIVWVTTIKIRHVTPLGRGMLLWVGSIAPKFSGTPTYADTVCDLERPNSTQLSFDLVKC